MWERKDYFIHEKKLQMKGSYTDTSCKIQQDEFLYYYPTGNLQTSGKYNNGKKEGLWLNFYVNGMMKDSIMYNQGNKTGTSYAWHINGYEQDSAVWNDDGSGVEVSWFDNGNAASAGRYSAGYKMNGKWQFFHKNGKLSATELYNDGVLKDKQYFDEDGSPTDTVNSDKEAVFTGGIKAWQKYLYKNLYFPTQYKFENADKAVVVVSAVIDEEGNVTETQVYSPLYPAFDDIALNVIKKSPKWQPAIQHNRRVKYAILQPVYFLQQ